MAGRFDNPWIGTVLRVLLAATLLYAGLVKLFDFDASRVAILAYRIVPPSWAPGMAVALPAVEVLVGLMLLIGFAVRWAALVAAILMVMFMAGIISVWVRGYSIDCGCFGGGGEVTPEGKDLRYTLELLRDSAFTAMAVWLVVRPATRFSVGNSVAAYSVSSPQAAEDASTELAGADDQQGAAENG